MFEALNRILDLVPEALYPIHDFQEASGSNISATSSLATANSSSSESVSRDSSSQNNLGGHLEDNNNSESESFSEMGNAFSPDANVEATLYYFEGRGLADQIRWLLAYTGTSFKQRAVNTRSKFVALMGSGLLSFDQMPLLQIDGLNLVQSQAIVRYVGRRAGLQGKTPQEEAEVDMVAEAIRDCLGMLVGMPFKRADSTEEKASKDTALLKWHKSAPKFEKRLASSENASLVGAGPTYADVLLAHLVTWAVEELGPGCVERYPHIVDLQCEIISGPYLQRFIRSNSFYPIGDQKYVDQVSAVLGRKI